MAGTIDGNVTIGDYNYTLYSDGTAGVRVLDQSKSSYGPLQETITYNGSTYTLTEMNWGSPLIGYYGCFAYCTALTTAPEIPSSVVNMELCFQGCTALTTAPSIPSSVRSMNNCFENCIALTGTIDVYGTPTYYSNCFRNTTQPITLAVSDESEIPTWREVALTSHDGNVTVIYADNNPEPTAILAVTRVAAKGDTTEYDYGQWAYVQVATIASTEQAPDNVADTPTITLDGATVTPQQASGTANYVGWLSLGDEAAHTIGATPHDTYKTGQEVTVTLVPAYSPMEFHATPVYDEHGTLTGYIGGDGAAFGQHATRAGWLDVAWNISSADGNPYCSDGTNVKVGGQTVGSADNLSYVASTDTFRAPTATTLHVASSATAVFENVSVYFRIGRMVFVMFHFGLRGAQAQTMFYRLFDQLPAGTRETWALLGNTTDLLPVTIKPGGYVQTDSTPLNKSAYYAGFGFYLAAD